MYHILPFLSSVACFIKKWFHKRHYEGVKKEKLSKEMPTFTVAKSKKRRKIEPMDNIPFSSLTAKDLNRTKELLSEELKRQSPIGTINHQQVNGCQLLFMTMGNRGSVVNKKSKNNNEGISSHENVVGTLKLFHALFSYYSSSWIFIKKV